MYSFVDCIYELDAADLQRGSETFKDAQAVVTKSLNTITTVFESPRYITELHLQTNDASTVDITVTDKNGVEQTVVRIFENLLRARYACLCSNRCFVLERSTFRCG